jgi:hypothetical protein
VIYISKSALRISESPNYIAGPWLCAVLRTVATRIWEPPFMSFDLLVRMEYKSRYVKSPVQISCLPIGHSKFAFPRPVPLSRTCTKPKRTPEPLSNLKMEPGLVAGFLSSLPATTRMFHPGSSGHFKWFSVHQRTFFTARTWVPNPWSWRRRGCSAL